MRGRSPSAPCVGWEWRRRGAGGAARTIRVPRLTLGSPGASAPAVGPALRARSLPEAAGKRFLLRTPDKRSLRREAEVTSLSLNSPGPTGPHLGGGALYILWVRSVAASGTPFLAPHPQKHRRGELEGKENVGAWLFKNWTPGCYCLIGGGGSVRPTRAWGQGLGRGRCGGLGAGLSLNLG